MQLIEVTGYLKDFEKIVNSKQDQQKENLNSITLKSEYSDDINEFMKETNKKNMIKTNKIKLIDLNFERSRTFTPKVERKKDRTNYENKSIIDSSIITYLNSCIIDKTSFPVKSLTKSLTITGVRYI